MTKIFFLLPAAFLALGLASRPAFAQYAPNSAGGSSGGSSPSGNMQAPPLQPKSSDTSAPLPPAVPGAGNQSLNTAPSVAKPRTGDPTAQLFTAINGNDYGSAQDAISRGADLNGQNALGETPIDLSVSLNRNSITFMILAARNESGDDPDASGPPPTTPVAKYSSKTKHAKPVAAVPIKLIETPTSAPGNNPGTPNASAGFLGFDK